MDDDEAVMDLGIIDNFNEDEVELNTFSAEDSAKPVPYVTNNRVPSIPRKCIRKGDLVCYVKNENINMINGNTQRSATPTYSVNSDSKTRSSSETDNILSGESLYKTFIFEESLNDNDTQKCIAFWKSVMEKNLTPIKCTIIENKKKRAKELKVEQEKKSSIIENREDIIKEATDKVHAEYKAMWMAALKEIKQKKLDKVKLVGQARCKLCETIENPMEEYSTDIDSVTIKEEVKGLNQWESVSKRPKRGEIRGGEEIIKKLKQKEKEQTQYKFVNVIEEKKKSGTYKLWRSNMVKPPCSCGKKNCECNINPAIICMRTPLSQLMAKPSKPTAATRTSKKEVTPKASSRSYKEVTPKPSAPEKGLHIEQLSKPSQEMTPKSFVDEKPSYKGPVPQPVAEETPHTEITPKPPAEEKKSFKEQIPQPIVDKPSRKEMAPKPSKEEKGVSPQPQPLPPMYEEILSRPSETQKGHYPEASSQTPIDQISQTDREIISKVVPFEPVKESGDSASAQSSLSDIAEDVSGVLVRRATPFIMEIADSVYREISAMSTLPYADASTFLKMPSQEFLAEVSQLVLAKARDLMESISENLLQEISQIIVSKARPMFGGHAEKTEAEEDMEVQEKDTIYTEVVHEPAQYPDSIPLTSSMKKITSEQLSPEPSLVMERQVSILLPTGEVEITKDHSVDTNMDTSWDKPNLVLGKVPASARKGSLEMIKARKQMVKKPEHPIEKPPSLVAVVSSTVDSEVQTDFNLAILHQGKGKPTATSESVPAPPVDHGDDQSQSTEKNDATDTKDIEEHTSSKYKKPKDPLSINRERESKHKSNAVELLLPEGQTSNIDEDINAEAAETVSVKSEFEEPIPRPRRVPRDSIFVTKERVARHKKEMKETQSSEEPDAEMIHRQIRLLSEITSTSNTKKIDSRNLRDSIFVNKERVSKHKSDMAEDSIREIDDVEPENGQTTTPPEPTGEMEMRPIDSRSLRDSIFVNKERVSKHKQEMSEESLDDVDDSPLENRQIRISEPFGTVIKKKKIKISKDSFPRKRYQGSHDEPHKIDKKERQVRLMSSPVDIKPHKQTKLDVGSIKDSVYVRKEEVAKTNPRMLDHKPVRDSLYVNKERVSKHKKDMAEESFNDVDDTRHITIGSEPPEAEIHKKNTKAMSIKDSIPVQKEHVAKHKKEEEDESINDEEDAELENRTIHISKLKEEDIHIRRTNPMVLKDSVFVTKERVEKHRKEMGEESVQSDIKNRQIRIISTATEPELKKKKIHSKDSYGHKHRKHKSKESYSDPLKSKEKHQDNEIKNRRVREPFASVETDIDMITLPDETVDTNESEKIDSHVSAEHTTSPTDVPVPTPSNEIDLTALLNSNQIADSILIRKEKLEKTHPRMIRNKPTKTKDSHPHPVLKQKLNKRGKKNEGLVSQVIYETDYENIKEKDPIGNTESVSIKKESVYACDPCFCIKCPALKITRTSGKGRKKAYSCPMHSGNKKEKKKKCRLGGTPITQELSAISKPDSTGGTSLKVLLSGVSAEESKYTEF